MRECGIPCDAIHLDIDYMDHYKVFTWTPDKERYPDPEKMTQIWRGRHQEHNHH